MLTRRGRTKKELRTEGQGTVGEPFRAKQAVATRQDNMHRDMAILTRPRRRHFVGMCDPQLRGRRLGASASLNRGALIGRQPSRRPQFYYGNETGVPMRKDPDGKRVHIEIDFWLYDDGSAIQVSSGARRAMKESG